MMIKPAATAALIQDDIKNFIVASTPGGIEAQEAAGQRTLVASEMLPIKIERATQEQLVALGFVFGLNVDKVFVNCKLPPGWKKEATDHSMWSRLVDDKGYERATIFFKAAFYDYHAHMTFRGRFSFESYGETPQANSFVVRLRDACGKVERIFGTWSHPNYHDLDDLERRAKAWLDENYPEHKNPFAYWED
jgi:hypothetical protein